jgi:hypothetical protein
MQFVNDDMDDLWRRAGQEYPLNTSGADWDKVARGLGLPVTEPAVARRDRRQYLWLLLLLLVPVICMHPFSAGSGDPGKQTAHQNSISKKPATDNPEPDARQEADNVLNPSKTREATGNAGSTGMTTSGATTIPADKKGASQNIATKTNAPSKGVAAPAPLLKNDAKDNGTKMLAAVKTSPSRKQKTSLATHKIKSGSHNVPASSDVVPVAAAIMKDPGLDGKKEPAIPTQDLAIKKPSALPGDTVAKIIPPPVTLAPKNDSAQVADSKSKKQKPPRVPHFYAGIVGGIGATTVKGQAVKKAGVDLGVVIGYQINKHFTVEAGAFWSRKHYYSKASYLNTQPYLPAYYKLTDVTGDCRMIEIPVNMQYHFRYSRRGNWFATAGASSYLMQREDYNYTTYNAWANTTKNYDWTYMHATRDWMAVVQLSAGYRFELKRRFQLRVEPYVQIPVKDAGYGRLPLTSGGVRVGILKNLF